VTLQELYEELEDKVKDYPEYDIRFLGKNSRGADVDGVEVDTDRGSIYLVEGF